MVAVMVMVQAVAGCTLLAYGNGAPDILTANAALHGADDLALVSPAPSHIYTTPSILIRYGLLSYCFVLHVFVNSC